MSGVRPGTSTRPTAGGFVRRLATSRYDALAGRYLHSEHDDVDELLRRTDEVPERDLNTIRLRRNQGWSGAIAPAVSMQRRVRIAFFTEQSFGSGCTPTSVARCIGRSTGSCARAGAAGS